MRFAGNFPTSRCVNWKGQIKVLISTGIPLPGVGISRRFLPSLSARAVCLSICLISAELTNRQTKVEWRMIAGCVVVALPYLEEIPSHPIPVQPMRTFSAGQPMMLLPLDSTMAMTDRQRCASWLQLYAYLHLLVVPQFQGLIKMCSCSGCGCANGRSTSSHSEMKWIKCSSQRAISRWFVAAGSGFRTKLIIIGQITDWFSSTLADPRENQPVSWWSSCSDSEITIICAERINSTFSVVGLVRLQLVIDTVQTIKLKFCLLRHLQGMSLRCCSLATT